MKKSNSLYYSEVLMNCLGLIAVFAFINSEVYPNVDAPNPYTVMAVSGLNLRSTSGLESEVLKVLPFGTVLYSKFSFYTDPVKITYPKDTINGVVGYWIDAYLEEGQLKGYVFSPYLFPGDDLINEKIGTTEFRIAKEGIACVSTNYHPDLNWYGVYKENKYFFLRKVEIELLLSSVTPIDEFGEGYGLGSPYRLFFLKTNHEERSLFLLGVNKELDQGKISTFLYAEDIGFSANDRDGFLKTYQEKQFQYNSKFYEIRAFEKSVVDKEWQVSKKYQLEASVSSLDDQDELFITSNISDQLGLCCSAERHTLYRTPQIEWLGDINQDGWLDLVVYQHTMTDGCGVCWTTSLLISKLDGQFVHPFQLISEAEDCGCY